MCGNKKLVHIPALYSRQWQGVIFILQGGGGAPPIPSVTEEDAEKELINNLCGRITCIQEFLVG